MQGDTFVSVKGLSKSYGDIRALKEISFSVSRNEIFGFIGPDGAGKTSLFRILTSLLLPDNGTVAINGFDPVNDFKKIREITGYMPGRFSLYQDLSVKENLEFFATVFGTTVEENYELISLIYSQIEPFKNRKAIKLSGGMKQKLALSCALIHKPEILILDEPTTGVDAVSRKEFWSILKDLKNKGITIIVSTPYMDEAGMCDRVALIQQGEILKIDTPSGIRASFPNSLYSVRSDDLYAVLIHLRAWEKTHTVFAFGQELHLTVKGDHLDREEFNDWLNSKGLKNVVYSKITAGIEDCFMELSASKSF